MNRFVFLFILGSSVVFPGEWVETTQSDFRDGRYERDIYCSQRDDGSVEFTLRWDANNDAWIDITNGESIFWGSDSGFFDNISTSYSGWGGSCYADLNYDGYTDFINSAVNIYWGSPSGPDPQNCTDLLEGEEALLVADFNKDGYLDIAYDYAGYTNCGIYWGSTDGYKEENKTHLPAVQAQHNLEVADLNKDGWLDLIVPNQRADYNTIYWGSDTGFVQEDSTRVPYLSSYIHGLSVADLDNDGWLDLVFTGNYNINESWIYWGPDYSASENTVLTPGESYGGSTVCDFNKDGKLDIVYFRGAVTQYQTVTYWGDGQRFQTDSCNLVGPYIKSSCGFVGDFNQDGCQDIFLNGFDGWSPVLYGPDYNDSVRLSAGSHHSMACEIGNVYSREYKEEYYSSIFDAGKDVVWTRMYWEDSCPGNSNIILAVRTGDTPDTSQGWSSWFTVQNGKDIPGMLNSRCIQYRATFEYPNPAYLPVLFLVGIEYTLEGIIVRPDCSLQGVPLDTITTQLDVLNYTHNPDIVEISWTNGTAGWFHEVSDSLGNPLGDADSDGSPDVGVLPPEGGLNKLRVRIGVPGSTHEGTADTFVVYGRSSNTDTLYDSAVLITKVVPYGILTIEPDQQGSITPDEADISYLLKVINERNRNETGEITYKSVLGWAVVLYDSSGRKDLKDSNGNGIRDVGELEALGGSAELTFEIQMPSELDPTMGVLDSLSGPVTAVETTTVYVCAASDGYIGDSAVLVTSAMPGLSLHNFPNPFSNQTRIVWSQPEQGEVTLRLADRAGREVVEIFSQMCEAGVQSYIWQAATKSGTALAPGVYVFLLEFKSEDGVVRHVLEKALYTGKRE